MRKSPSATEPDFAARQRSKSIPLSVPSLVLVGTLHSKNWPPHFLPAFQHLPPLSLSFLNTHRIWQCELIRSPRKNRGLFRIQHCVNTTFYLQFFSINLYYQILFFNIVSMKENSKDSFNIFRIFLEKQCFMRNIFSFIDYYIKN